MVDSINGANAATAVHVPNYEGALTPDSLMAYCASKLRGLDEQINAQFAKQQQARKAQTALGILQDKLVSLASKGGIKPDDPTSRDIVLQLFDEAMAALPDGPEKEQLFHQFYAFKDDVVRSRTENGVQVQYKGDDELSKEDAGKFAEAVGRVAKDLGSSSELQMINMNSIMSQRQLAVQMCTNMVSNISETAKSIIQKMA